MICVLLISVIHYNGVDRNFNPYVGYYNKNCLTSSSDGMATYLIEQLFTNDIVDAVVTVVERNESFYEYSVIRSIDDLISTLETKY